MKTTRKKYRVVGVVARNPEATPLEGRIVLRPGDSAGKATEIKKVKIRFGEPMDFSRYAGMAGDRFIERAVTDEIMYELMELSGREYVDVYAQKVKAQQAKKQAATEEPVAA